MNNQLQPSRPVALNPLSQRQVHYAHCVVVAGVAEKPNNRVSAIPTHAEINTSLLSRRRALPQPCGWVGVVPRAVEAAFVDFAFAHAREVEGQRHA